MSDQSVSTSVIDDNRAVSSVIGVVILFGFLILALSLYQVEVVPQQNAETEFQHSGEVRNDLVELRAGILQAGSIDQPQYQTVQLGTTYSTRVFAINPPPPSGTIRTTDSYPITISNNSGTPEGTITIPTRFIEYRPGYNELDRSPTWYDASVLYLDARDEGGGIAVIEDQNLVDDGEVQITALQNEFRRSGTGRITLELRPAENVTGNLPKGDLTVTIPTRLSEDDWETKTNLPTNTNVYGGVTDTGDDINNRNVYNLTLNTTASNLTVDTVGVQEAPESPTQNDKARLGNGPSDGGSPGDGDDGDSSTSADQIQYVVDSGSATQFGSRVDFEIQNNGNSNVTITGIKIDAQGGGLDSIREQNVFSGPTGHEVFIDSSTAGIYEDANDPSGALGYEVGTEQSLTQNGILSQNENAQVTLAYFRNNGGNLQSAAGKELTVTLYFQDGSDLTFSFTP
ncbi:hypothetical protein [Halorubrum sp. FL23]|uniref:hypothetical protein n=1 Tax=Halorubrum sp. FL23 TaxID=3458704 RepID=UPI0040333106